MLRARKTELQTSKTELQRKKTLQLKDQIDEALAAAGSGRVEDKIRSLIKAANLLALTKEKMGRDNRLKRLVNVINQRNIIEIYQNRLARLFAQANQIELLGNSLTPKLKRGETKQKEKTLLEEGGQLFQQIGVAETLPQLHALFDRVNSGRVPGMEGNMLYNRTM